MCTLTGDPSTRPLISPPTNMKMDDCPSPCNACRSLCNDEQILVAYLEKLKVQSAPLMNGFHNVKQQVVASGHQMSDRKIMEEAIFPHFKRIWDESQRAVYEEYDVLEEEVEDAVTTYVF